VEALRSDSLGEFQQKISIRFADAVNMFEYIHTLCIYTHNMI